MKHWIRGQAWGRDYVDTARSVLILALFLLLQAKKKVLAAALGFGPGWQECGLPHPVPIACVGCGACDSELLQIISKITKGMYVIVTNVSELSTFFKRQVK